MNLLDRYEDIVGHQEVERLRRLAERLAGKRIVHVNSTRSGGGVAEILGWMVPLMEELGIQRPLGSDRRIARLLSRHQGLSQRHAGAAGIAAKKRLRSALRDQSRERRAAESAGGHRFRTRSATGLPAALHAARPGGAMDLALPYRRLASQSQRVEVPGTGHRPLRRGHIFHARLRPADGLPEVPDLCRPSIRCRTRTARFPRRNGWRPFRGWASIRSGRSCCRSRGSIASRTRWA